MYLPKPKAAPKKQHPDDLPGRATPLRYAYAPSLDQPVIDDVTADIRFQRKSGRFERPRWEETRLIVTMHIEATLAALRAEPCGVTFSLRKGGRPFPYVKPLFGIDMHRRVGEALGKREGASFVKGKSHAEGGKGWQTTLTYTPEYARSIDLEALMSACKSSDHSSFNPVIIRERGVGAFVSFDPEEEPYRSDIRALGEFNAFQQDTKLDLDACGLPAMEVKIAQLAGKSIRYSKRYILDPKLGLVGGRHYDQGFQTLKKSVRHQMRIDGQAVVEVDVANCHPRLIYALLRKIMPPGDMYQIIADECGTTRKAVKTVIGVGLGAPQLRNGAFAIYDKLAKQNIEEPHAVAQKVVDFMERYYRPIHDHLFKDTGVQLQKIEGDIQTLMLEPLVRHQIRAILIHDSLVTQMSAESQTKEELLKAWRKTTGTNLQESALAGKKEAGGEEGQGTGNTGRHL